MRPLSDLAAQAGDVARPFWAAMAEGRIDVPSCRVCGRAFFFPRRYCPNCQSPDVGWITASGRGAVFALTVVHVPFPPVEAAQIPYAAGLVDLEEGVRIPARFDLGDLPAVGQAVRAAFPAPGELPVFLPAGPAS